jgi:hypothetical protein
MRAVDPDAEAARLIAGRGDPPGLVWGVRHPGGKVTVRHDGFAFPLRIMAEAERDCCDALCDWCEGGKHALAARDTLPWRDVP